MWIRDLLLWFAHYDLYTPKWSKHIFDEWDEVMMRKGIKVEDRIKRMAIINEAFPDALVENYESLIGMLELPDEKDKHVLAVAIKTNANLIVSNNLKDFPSEYLAGFSISAKNADDFLTDMVDLNHDTSIRAFKDLVLNKKNPPYDEFEVLDILRRNGLKDTADYLHALL